MCSLLLLVARFVTRFREPCQWQFTRAAFTHPVSPAFPGAEEVIDYQFGFQIEALPQTVAFIGVRHLEVELDEGDYELDDDNLHLGVRLTF